MPAHFKLLSGDTRKVLDEPYQGCPGGVIADEPEEHSLFAEFGMYYKEQAHIASREGGALLSTPPTHPPSMW